MKLKLYNVIEKKWQELCKLHEDIGTALNLMLQAPVNSSSERRESSPASSSSGDDSGDGGSSSDSGSDSDTRSSTDASGSHTEDSDFEVDSGEEKKRSWRGY